MRVFGFEITGARIVGIAIAAMIGYGGFSVYSAVISLAATLGAQ